MASTEVELQLLVGTDVELQSLARTEDEVVVDIDETLLLSSIHERRLRKIPEPCTTIYRVPEDIRKDDPEAYCPLVVAIGPYHRNTATVLPMERFKSKYLDDLISRHQSNGVEKYIAALSSSSFLTKASKCYSEPVDISHSGNSFVEMLMFDGCFIIEFLIKYQMEEKMDELVDICDIERDLRLLENQIPFFVLEALFNSTEGVPHREESGTVTLKKLAFSFFSGDDVDSYDESFDNISAVVHHLLHLCHSVLPPPKKKRQQHSDLSAFPIPTASELHKYGIKFKKKETNHILDITFKNGVMEIPWIAITKATKSELRNMLAFEVSYPAAGNYMISYISFMDNLIDTAGDVALLDQSGVMVRSLAGHEEVARFFNSIGKEAYLDYNHHYLKEVLLEVTEYCSHKKHRWRASIMNDYFYSPWSTMSVIAAVILLLLTLAQTLFAMLAYFRPP